MDTKNCTHYINPNSPHTVVGSRQKALRRFRDLPSMGFDPVVEWVRACGTKSVVFFRDPETGRRRQRTIRYARLAFREPVKPWN